MAEKKGNSGCLGVVLFAVALAIGLGLMFGGGDDVPATPATVRMIDLEGVQFKIVAEQRGDIQMTDRLLALSVGAIRQRGYRCDTVNAARPLGAFADHAGFKFHCNGYRYKYLIEDRGGNWTVRLD